MQKNISTSSTRKVAKMARKLMRNATQEKFKDLRDIIKPCPRFVPLWLWVWTTNLVIDLNIWENKINNNKAK